MSARHRYTRFQNCRCCCAYECSCSKAFRRPSVQEARAASARVPDVDGCDVGHWVCDGWLPGGVCPHDPRDEGCTCGKHGGLDTCDVHGESVLDCGWDLVHGAPSAPLTVKLLEALR